MCRFKNSETIPDIRTGSDSQAANLRRASVRDVIAIQVRRGQHGVFVRPRDHLLEDGIGNAVVDH